MPDVDTGRFHRLYRGRRVWRIALATSLLAAVAIVGQPVPQAAAAVYCQERLTPHHWTQKSCIEWRTLPARGMYGNGTIQMITGFNREKVRYCRVYLQLVASYGTKQPEIGYDCLPQARKGGRFSFPFDATGRPYDIYWGSGRRSGDAYYQYAWMEVWTSSGGHYDGRAWAAKSTITRP